jgi:hypothetical protein
MRNEGPGPVRVVFFEDADFEFLDEEERELIEAMEDEADWVPAENMDAEIQRYTAIARLRPVHLLTD